MINIWNADQEIIIQCCSCRRLRRATGEWQELAEIQPDNQALFSHSVCPICLVELYPELVSAIGFNL